MNKKSILLIGAGGVLATINKPGSVFSIKARKVNGDVTIKTGCVALRGTNALNEHKIYNRGGLLKLYQPQKSHKFELYIDLIKEFNGMTVIHPY
jgi:hypothetical protein